MDPFILYFNWSDPKYDNRKKYLFAAVSVLFLLCVTATTILKFPWSIKVVAGYSIALLAGLAFGLPYYLIMWEGLTKRETLRMSDEAFSLERCMGRWRTGVVPATFFWRDVASVDIGPIKAAITFNDGTHRDIVLDFLMYEELQTVKRKLQDILQSKNIPFTIATH